MFIICQSMGFPPISTMGFGLMVVSSDRRVPNPPARIATFMSVSFESFCVEECPKLYLWFPAKNLVLSILKIRQKLLLLRKLLLPFKQLVQRLDGGEGIHIYILQLL